MKKCKQYYDIIYAVIQVCLHAILRCQYKGKKLADNNISKTKQL